MYTYVSRSNPQSIWMSISAKGKETALEDPYVEQIARLKAATLAGPGTLDAKIRQAVATGQEVPEALARYVQKVAKHAYKVTDEDVQALLEAGYSQDQIFEATASTALGAGLARLEAALAVLQKVRV